MPFGLGKSDSCHLGKPCQTRVRPISRPRGHNSYAITHTPCFVRPISRHPRPASVHPDSTALPLAAATHYYTEYKATPKNNNNNNNDLDNDEGKMRTTTATTTMTIQWRRQHNHENNDNNKTKTTMMTTTTTTTATIPTPTKIWGTCMLRAVVGSCFG